MKKTILLLTALASLSIANAKADRGTQTDQNGNYAFSWTTYATDNRNGYYTYELTIRSWASRLHFSYLGLDRIGGEEGTYGYGGIQTFSYTTTNPRAQWYWTFDSVPAKYNARNVAALLKVGTRLTNTLWEKPGKPGVVVKSDANGVSIKWKKDKMSLFDSSTETMSYSYDEVADHLNSEDFEFQPTGSQKPDRNAR